MGLSSLIPSSRAKLIRCFQIKENIGICSVLPMDLRYLCRAHAVRNVLDQCHRRPGRNSATIAKTLGSRRPTGSVGSWIAPPRLNLTFRLVSSSKMSRASAAIGRAGPALSPPRCHQTGSQPALTGVRVGSRLVAVSPWSTYAIITNPRAAVALGGEVLLLY